MLQKPRKIAMGLKFCDVVINSVESWPAQTARKH